MLATRVPTAAHLVLLEDAPCGAASRAMHQQDAARQGTP
jgi:hypothetical protein